MAEHGVEFDALASAGSLGAPKTKRAARQVDEPLVTRAHAELREQLLQGQFPLWERLAEARLATRLGVSRTPVREALRRLEREELIILDDGGSYRPRAPDLDHLGDLYAVRLHLEEMSVRLACDAGVDHDGVRALLEEWTSLEEPSAGDADFVYRDESFHVGLAKAGRNRALAETLRSINDRIRLVRVQDFLDPDRIAVTIRQHVEILRAVDRRDADVGNELMWRHITESASLVADRASKALARMLQPKEPL